MGYTVTISSEVKVEFSHPDLAESYFLKSDWKEVFFTFSDMEELVEWISMAVFNEKPNFMPSRVSPTGEAIFVKEVEGLPLFYDRGSHGWWDHLYVASDPEIGEIVVRFDDLDVDAALYVGEH